MASYELSEEADARLAEIYEYSIREFGRRTATRYLSGMHEMFGLLAENPHIGTNQEWIQPGFWRLVHKSHVIYYTCTATRVLIVDILHESQDAVRRFQR